MITNIQHNNAGNCAAISTHSTEFNGTNGLMHHHHRHHSSAQCIGMDKYSGVITERDSDPSKFIMSSSDGNYTKDNANGINGIIMNNNIDNINNNGQEAVTYYLLKTINAVSTNLAHNVRINTELAAHDTQTVFDEQNHYVGTIKVQPHIVDWNGCNADDKINGRVGCQRSDSPTTEDNDSNGSPPIIHIHGGVPSPLQPTATTNGIGGNEKLAPDHHARRPMNAFLIFCKRHRAIVRERYPNLENRAITKILGDWWANLDKDEKECYTSLAKQYKDAFFTANPNFKWYKLPAPPLRTLSMGTRPYENQRHDSFSSDYEYYGSVSPTKSINGIAGFNFDGSKDTATGAATAIGASATAGSAGGHKKCEKNKSNVGYFKLADEAQMGGLNSLMRAVEVVSGAKFTNNNNCNKYQNENKLLAEANGNNKDDIDNKDELHRVLGETRSFFQSTINGCVENPDMFSLRPFETNHKLNHFNNNNNNNNDGGDKIIPRKSYDKNVSSNSSPESKNYEFDSYEEDGSGADSVIVKKSSRACKGKRYLEFMGAHKVNPTAKKSKSRTTSMSSAASLSPTFETPRYPKSLAANTNSVQKIEYELFDHLYANNHHCSTISLPTEQANNNNKLKTEAATADKMEVDECSDAVAKSNTPIDNQKFFDANDFDLEEKIKALPAHSLEKYLSRKRDTTKKKRPNGKRTSSNSSYNRKSHAGTKPKSKAPVAKATVAPKTIQEAKELRMMVGSQKRKARKESITRRDVRNADADSVSPSVILIDNASGLVQTSVPMTTTTATSTFNSSQNTNAPSDLLMLATMAEAAAAYYAS